MAIAYSVTDRRPDVGRNVVVITLDGSYGAGGYALDNASMGLIGNPTNVDCSNYVHATATSANVAQWDKTNNKVKIFEGNTATNPLVECVSGDITSGHSIVAVVTGTPRL